MKPTTRVVTFCALLAIPAVLACEGDDHDHDHKARNWSPPRPIPSGITAPTRPLVWGDFNVIHTTDSHGWLLGHQHTSEPEPNYSGTFGDFASFVQHMKEIALEKNVDIILADTGDLHDGTGLTDGFPPGGVDAHDANQFFKQLPYDVLAIGNHELYDWPNTYDMYTNFVPHFPGRYLSSNVNITILNDQNQTVSVPVGSRYAKFKTRLGRSITSLGVLYDFTGNAENTTVQFVADMVQEAWFAEAIKEEPDLFLLLGHMPVSEDNWPTVFNAVRAVHPLTPIIILGGHTHIRDCNQPDGRSIALESGRYMETVGWLSADLSKTDSKENITFTRRYLDPNRITYEFHTNTNQWDFDTPLGEEVTSGLEQLAVNFDLSYLYGVAPQSYYLSRAPFPSNDSLLSLFIQTAAPVALTINNTRKDIPNLMIVNSGEQRFDLYQGNFTKNDQLTASPFTDAFLFIPNVTLAVANQIVPALNGDEDFSKRAITERRELRRAAGFVDHRYNRWLREQSERAKLESRATVNATIGYVTQDECPGIGDDTLHTPLPYYDAPDYISSNAPALADDAPIDLVFINFIESDLLKILNKVQNTTKYTSADVQSYTPVLADAVLGIYAQTAWN